MANALSGRVIDNSDLTVSVGILRCHFLVNQSFSCSGKGRALLSEQLFLHLRHLVENRESASRLHHT